MTLSRAGIALLGLAFAGLTAAQTPSQPPETSSAVLPAPPQPLGRLFFTPVQRASLDDMRSRPQPGIGSATATELPPAPAYVTLNGVVRSSDGATTVWLNDKPVRGRESADGVLITNSRGIGRPGDVRVVVPQTGNVVDLKVGQQFDVNTGLVKERQPSTLNDDPQSAAGAAERRRPGELALRERRAARDREALRDLLRDIEPGGASPSPTDAATAR